MRNLWNTVRNSRPKFSNSGLSAVESGNQREKLKFAMLKFYQDMDGYDGEPPAP